MKRMLAMALAALALSGCGAQEASVVKSALTKDISSANVTVALSVKAPDGETTFGLSGPYRSNGDGNLPSVNFDLAFSGPTPRSIEAQIISTGDDAFVVYGGDTYEVGRDKLDQLQLAGGTSNADVVKLMSRMRDWFPESDASQDATLNGEPVTRVTGKLDLGVALKDMKAVAEQPGVSGFEGLKQLSGGDLKALEKSVSDPRFTVDVAKSDGKLRRIAATMKIADQGSLSFSLQLKDVDKPVTITAPATGKPIAELLQRLQQEFGATAPAESTIS